MHFLVLLTGMRLKNVTQKLSKIFRIINIKANSEMDLSFFMALPLSIAIGTAVGFPLLFLTKTKNTH